MLSISVVLPAYNEEENVDPAVMEAIEVVGPIADDDVITRAFRKLVRFRWRLWVEG